MSYPCPPCCGEPAAICQWCNGEVGNSIQLNIAGVADKDCAECDPDLNAPFILTNGDAYLSGGPCVYGYSEDPFGCANIGCGAGEDHVIRFVATHTKVGADYIFRVRAYECECTSVTTDTCIDRALWEKNFGTSKPDCLFTSTPLDIPLISGDATDMCDWSSATCSVEVV